jgi:peptidoglycan hydrolase CwlO-like protein
MLTLKTENRILTRLKSLTEIELQSLFDELRPYLEKNKMLHVLTDENVSELHKEIDNIQEELDDIERERDSLKETCESAATDLDSLDLDADDADEKIQSIISDLRR